MDTFTFTITAAGQTLLEAGKDIVPTRFHSMIDRLRELADAGGSMTINEDDDRFDGLDTRGFVEVS